MSAPLMPASLAELAEAVRSGPRVLAVGAGTKPSLSAVEAVKISTLRLSGITEYEPSEFTFTALAGTSIREIVTALAERGQYLPFDPMCRDSGATLGGTVAAGLSGPGRLRFGGLRDFILGVRFVDGTGRWLRMGGKVVKNAAGFDLPKFFVGSLGRLGVLGELTFKVFPKPPSTLTLKLSANTAQAATEILIAAANTRWEPDALDLLPGETNVCLRLAGPPGALQEIAREILARWPGEKVSAADAETLWSELREFTWAHAGGPLVKVVLTPDLVPRFYRELFSLEGARVHVSAGGNVAFVAIPSVIGAAALDEQLRTLGVPGIALRGGGPLWCGAHKQSKLAAAVKNALDPEHRFPELPETIER
jgi:glycolate oxidase FAD binding subunit